MPTSDKKDCVNSRSSVRTLSLPRFAAAMVRTVRGAKPVHLGNGKSAKSCDFCGHPTYGRVTLARVSVFVVCVDCLTACLESAGVRS